MKKFLIARLIQKEYLNFDFLIDHIDYLPDNFITRPDTGTPDWQIAAKGTLDKERPKWNKPNPVFTEINPGEKLHI